MRIREKEDNIRQRDDYEEEIGYDKCYRDYEAWSGEQKTSAMGEHAPCVDGE